ncbi:hypothetical protein Poli38472_003136 [Pythium oligandrum]|uniref:Calmodulin-binding protein n=1 Tax=Pythium oligandrum TaxID=41045 RepID=A0A8K1FCI0_PYTOL|nr:hypothetical protein Poli38472_003136 [Pythium oligandrum]|eukprot:TMW57211.1 hypothetical protein Poli38472_003136 [Pythium oligandrum]
MKSSRSSASSTRFQHAVPSSVDFAANNAFQMPTYTSHASRTSPSKSKRAMSPPKAASRVNQSLEETPVYSESDQNLLNMLNSTVACLKEKNMDVEALGCMEQSLWLKRRMFGAESSTVHKALSEVVLSYNSIAMQFLAQGQFDQCLSMLRKAEAITTPGNFKNCQSLQILTYNNIGCCYRKLGKLKSALKYLKEAAQIGAGSTHVRNLSITHLNLCAIQSQLGRHDLALEHAQAAIFHTQEELVSLDEEESTRNNDGDDELAPLDVLDAKTREEKIISLAVAYHNLAVELEFNDRGEASLQWYKKALQLVWRFRESNRALCDSFQKIFTDAKHKYEAQKSAGGTASGPVGGTTVRSSSTANRPTANRPKSAHASSRAKAGEAGGRMARAPTGDVSYAGNVASQCYKPVKPSTAGLNYASPPKTKLKRNGSASTASFSQQQRPTSATASRRRPLSASKNRPAPPQRVSAEQEMANVVEQRWREIERDLLGRGEQEDVNTPSARAPTQRQRPQTARPTRQVDTSMREIEPDDMWGDEEGDCGVVDDDGDDDDNAFDEIPTRATPSTRSSKPSQSLPTGKHEESASSAKQHVSARHRQALDESRRSSMGDEEPMQSLEAHQQAMDRRASSESFGATNDDEGDVPRQRVSHMEYLRRMRKLAENIRDDLTDTPKPKVVVSAGTENHRPVKDPKMKKQASADGDAPQITPRGSSSKLRERLELVRRDSVQSLGAEDSGDASAIPKEAPTIVIAEDVHEIRSEVEARREETKLVEEASTRRLQCAIRATAARSHARALRQRKEEERAARIIQRKSRKFLEEARQREQEEEERALWKAQQAEIESLAAKLIQNVYRRKWLGQDTTHDGEEENYTPVHSAPHTAREPTHVETPSIQQASLSSHQSTPRRPSQQHSGEQDAALHIQSMYRGFHARQDVGSQYARRLSRSYIERQHFNLVLEESAAKEQSFLELVSAIKIQALVRGRQGRMLMEAIRIGRQAAAMKIQASFRRHQSDLQRSSSRGVYSIAARSIQQVFRAFARRRAQERQAEMTDEMNEVHHIAATTLQRFWRVHKADNDLELEQYEAATCIQALGRGHLARRSYQSLRASRSNIELSSQASAFSMTASQAQIPEEPREEYEEAFEEEELDRPPPFTGPSNTTGNFSFLPAAVREMYLRYVDSDSIPPIPQQSDDFNIADIDAMGLSMDDFLHELSSCVDAESANSSMDAMCMLVQAHPERYRTLQHLVKVALVLDRRIQQEGIWSAELEQSAVGFIHLFQDVLGF